MSKYGIELKWAVIFTVMGLVWMLIERLVGLHDEHIDQHMVYTNLIAIPAIAVYAFAMLDKKKNYFHGQMNYMQGFVSGVIITVIVTILSPLSQLITTYLITPEFFPNAINYAVDNGMMTPEEAEGYFNFNNYLLMGMAYAPVMGVLTSALVALFVRSRGGEK